MRLRSLTKHIRDQNWFAAALDFFIVVVGILIAFQVTNWNEGRIKTNEYNLALNRFEAETQANLETMTALESEVSESLVVVKTAFDALRSCEETSANRQAIERGLDVIKGTYGFRLRMSALNDLTNAQSLLSQQSESDRLKFSEMKFLFELLLHEGKFSEERPHQDTVQISHSVGYGSLTFREWQYFGFPQSGYERDLVLADPVNIACRSHDLLRSFYSWERAQSDIPNYTKMMRETLNDYLKETN